MSDLIAKEELDGWMKKVPEWEWVDSAIERTFEFDEFMEGIDFVNGVAEIAEEAQHHPDIQVSWTTVKLSLTTHDQGGITTADFELAGRIDNLVD